MSPALSFVNEVEDGKSVTVSFKVKVNKTQKDSKVTNIAKVNDGENEYNTNETVNPVKVPKDPDKPDRKVPTGDNSNVMLYMVMFMMSLIALSSASMTEGIFKGKFKEKNRPAPNVIKIRHWRRLILLRYMMQACLIEKLISFRCGNR